MMKYKDTSLPPTSSMALAQVREPPDIAQTHAEAHTGEQVLGFVVPFGPVARLLLLHPLQVGMTVNPLIQTWVWNLEWKPNHGGVCGSSEAGKCVCSLPVSVSSQRRSGLSLAASSRSEFYPSCTTLEKGLRYLLWPMVLQLSAAHCSLFYIM